MSTPSPPARRVVFVIGAPRSGTTWLQTLLGAHPAVVTPQETDFFSALIAPLQAGWDAQTARNAQGGSVRAKGLPGVLDDEEFSVLVADLVDRVFSTINRLDPVATVVVEKSPSHSHHVPLIRKYLPDAAFIHVIRDGRDVVRSLQSAAQGWGSYWASAPTGAGAQRWRDAVHAARLASNAGTYAEVRYEDLRANDPDPLQRAFAACGLQVDTGDCRSYLEQYSLARMASGQTESSIALGGALGGDAPTVREPEGFFGGGRVGGWVEEWSTRDRFTFDAVAGALLVELGYEPDRTWCGSTADRTRYRLRRALARVVGRTGRRMGTRLTRRSNRLLTAYPAGVDPRSTTRTGGSNAASP